MYFRAVALDYDGTLADHGAVDQEAVDALCRLRKSGRKIVLVTGREITDLRYVAPDLTLFDWVVAENGGVLYDPATATERLLAPSPPARLVQKLMENGIEPLSIGHTIVATWQPHEVALLGAIAELGLDHQIIFNKGAVMVLPAGINKATGLAIALNELGLSTRNVIGVGDAENDQAFLSICGGSVAVANALTSVKDKCDIKLAGDRGAGVRELVDLLVKDDFALLPPARRGVSLGKGPDGSPAWLTAQETLLIVGASGSGKSRFAGALIEQMIDQGFVLCVMDAEGDYGSIDGIMSIDSGLQASSFAEPLGLLSKGLNIVLGTTAISLKDRGRLFEQLVPRLMTLRGHTGRPHFLVVDEAHHYVTSASLSAGQALMEEDNSWVLITIDPTSLPQPVVGSVDHVIAFGTTALDLLHKCAQAPTLADATKPQLGVDEALLWSRASPDGYRRLRINSPCHRHQRHCGKYAVGDVGEAHSFYFRWSLDGTVLRARNLAEFIEKSEMLPDEVYMQHLRHGDFAAWFFHVIRDDVLGQYATKIAGQPGGNCVTCRAEITAAIRERYCIPA